MFLLTALTLAEAVRRRFEFAMRIRLRTAALLSGTLGLTAFLATPWIGFERSAFLAFALAALATVHQAWTHRAWSFQASLCIATTLAVATASTLAHGPTSLLVGITAGVAAAIVSRSALSELPAVPDRVTLQAQLVELRELAGACWISTGDQGQLEGADRAGYIQRFSSELPAGVLELLTSQLDDLVTVTHLRALAVRDASWRPAVDWLATHDMTMVGPVDAANGNPGVILFETLGQDGFPEGPLLAQLRWHLDVLAAARTLSLLESRSQQLAGRVRTLDDVNDLSAKERTDIAALQYLGQALQASSDAFDPPLADGSRVLVEIPWGGSHRSVARKLMGSSRPTLVLDATSSHALAIAADPSFASLWKLALEQADLVILHADAVPTSHALTLATAVVLTSRGPALERVLAAGVLSSDSRGLFSVHTAPNPLADPTQLSVQIQNRFVLRSLRLRGTAQILTRSALAELIEHPWTGGEIELDAVLDRIALSTATTRVEGPHVSSMEMIKVVGPNT